MSHTSLKKKLTMWQACHQKGPKRGQQQQQHKTECHQAQLLTMYQWNRAEEHLIKNKKKLFVLLLKHQQPTCYVDKPARQLNCSGMATQGRASVVGTALESSHLLHWNCIYSSIYIYEHEIMHCLCWPIVGG